MAYGTRYKFVFESINGLETEIDIMQEGWTDPAIQRSLGRAPILRMQQNGVIRGTSLDLCIECQEDGEFERLYTSDPKQFQVTVRRGERQIWSGFIVPELYSEPDIAPPYDVQVTATDGVGELKRYEFSPQGLVSLQDMFTYLLGFTGMNAGIYYISSIESQTPAQVTSDRLFREMTINLDFLEGSSCYDVLTRLLETLHAFVEYRDGAWWVIRETDVIVGAGTSATGPRGAIKAIDSAGNEQNVRGAAYALAGSRSPQGLGPDLWPVGSFSVRMEPAKNSATVQAPWHVGNPVESPDMESSRDYTTGTFTRYDSQGKRFQLLSGASDASAYIETAVTARMSYPVRCAWDVNIPMGTTSAHMVRTTYVFFPTGSGGRYILSRNDSTEVLEWVYTTNASARGVAFEHQVSTQGEDRSRVETIEDEVPALIVSDSAVEGRLQVRISCGSGLYVYHLELSVEPGTGYRDVVKITNGARNEGMEVEIFDGVCNASMNVMIPFFQGLFVRNSMVMAKWKSRNFSEQSFLALMAKDYALSVAEPRMEVSGVVDTPAEFEQYPLTVHKRGVHHIVQSFDWNLWQDEFDFVALARPSASISVASEDILPGASPVRRRVKGIEDLLDIAR